MTNYRVPKEGKFVQPNRGDSSGNLYITTNVDLKTNPGKMRVSPRLIVNTKDNDTSPTTITGMGVPLAFVYLSSKYWAACGIGSGSGTSGTGKMLVGTTSPTGSFTTDGTSNSPTNIHADISDMVYWQNGNYAAAQLGPSLFVTTFTTPSTTNIAQLYAGTTWTKTWFTGTVSGAFRTHGGPKNMWVASNHNLYILDDDRVIYVPIPTYQTNINAVLTSSGAANTQAGTVDFNGQYRGIWGRATATDSWIALMSFDQGNGAKGYMGRWDHTGTSLTQIIDIAAPCALSGCILENVIHIIDGFGILKKWNSTGFIEIARLPVANQNIEMPGIYNDQTNSRWIHQRGMEVVDGKINIAVNNFVSTGVYVEDMPSGIWEYDPQEPGKGLYHKSAPCADTNDWGQQLLLTAGALFGTKRAVATLLAGFAYYTDSGSTSRNAIFYDDVAHTTSRRAIVTFPWFNAGQINDTFQKIFYRYRQFVSGSKIIGKVRTDKSAVLPFVASITWTSTTTFTSTDANFANAVVGDEVEVVQGKGASTTAHISAIPAPVGGTYTVTLEDSIGFSSGSAKVKVNNFRKMGTIAQLLSSSQSLTVNKTDTDIQVKTEYRDEGGMEVDDVTITSTGQQQTK